MSVQHHVICWLILFLILDCIPVGEHLRRCALVLHSCSACHHFSPPAEKLDERVAALAAEHQQHSMTKEALSTEVATAAALLKAKNER